MDTRKKIKKRSVIKALLIVISMYVLPLLGDTGRLLDPRIWILASAGAVILLSQPEISSGGARSKAATDGYSVLLILFGGAVLQIAAIVEFGYFRDGNADLLPAAAGLAMLISGLAFRIWSIRILDRQFTATVEIVSDHRLIIAGPYRFIRHPSYLGAYVSMIGSAVLLGAWYSAALISAAMLMIYIYRISFEEKTLKGYFGAEYGEYCRKTSRMVPFAF